MAFSNIQVLEVSSNVHLISGAKQEQRTLNRKRKTAHLRISMRSNSFLKRKKYRDQSKSLEKQHQCVTSGKDRLALRFRFLHNRNVVISHQLRSTQRFVLEITPSPFCAFRLVRLYISISLRVWSSLSMQPTSH